jgi:hypothetical protein
VELNVPQDEPSGSYYPSYGSQSHGSHLVHIPQSWCHLMIYLQVHPLIKQTSQQALRKLTTNILHIIPITPQRFPLLGLRLSMRRVSHNLRSGHPTLNTRLMIPKLGLPLIIQVQRIRRLYPQIPILTMFRQPTLETTPQQKT